MPPNSVNKGLQMLLAILVGNIVYIALRGHLPGVLVHQRFQLDFGLLLDFLLCLGAYGIVRKIV